MEAAADCVGGDGAGARRPLLGCSKSLQIRRVRQTETKTEKERKKWRERIEVIGCEKIILKREKVQLPETFCNFLLVKNHKSTTHSAVYFDCFLYYGDIVIFVSSNSR